MKNKLICRICDMDLDIHILGSLQPFSETPMFFISISPLQVTLSLRDAIPSMPFHVFGRRGH